MIDETRLSAELELARDLLESDLRMAQRGELVASQTDGVVWMMQFDGVAASESFENVAIRADTMWRRAVEDVEKCIEERERLSA